MGDGFDCPSLHVGELGPAPRRVLVPLCGKTEDMAFLASKGHHVVGLEAIGVAAQAFFDEHGLAPEVSARGEHVRAYASGRVTIVVGDALAATRALVGEVDALYDRVALVALPAPDRIRYAAVLRGCSRRDREGSSSPVSTMRPRRSRRRTR